MFNLGWSYELESAGIGGGSAAGKAPAGQDSLTAALSKKAQRRRTHKLAKHTPKGMLHTPFSLTASCFWQPVASSQTSGGKLTYSMQLHLTMHHKAVLGPLAYT